jgi:hypothetical protein
MRFHGNWCGPYWSDGKVQTSVATRGSTTDELDEDCMAHDNAYANCDTSECLNEADDVFVRNASKRSVKGAIAAAAVYTNRFTRPAAQTNNSNNSNNSNNKMAKQNLRRKQKKSDLGFGLPDINKKSGTTVQFAPAAIATRRVSKAPTIKTKNGTSYIKHKEYIGAVNNYTEFTVDSYPVNPGMATTFPWLASTAAQFEKYKFTKLSFTYNAVAATNKTGSVMMSMDFDASDDTPLSKQSQAQTVPSAEDNVWCNNRLHIPVDNTKRFVRQGVVNNTDVKTYDLGKLHVSSIYGDNTIGGELYVEYEVELCYPTDPKTLTTVLSTSRNNNPLQTGFYNLYGYAMPFDRYDDTRLVCKAPGTYFLVIKANGTNITAIATPTEVSQIVIFHGLITSGTAAFAAYTLRADMNDTLYISDLFTADSITEVYYDITPADKRTFDSVA